MKIIAAGFFTCGILPMVPARSRRLNPGMELPMWRNLRLCIQGLVRRLWMDQVPYLLALGVIFCVGAFDDATAASISKIENANCKVLVQGQILPGDYNRFLKIVDGLFPSSDGESSAPDTVCLDSSGGSLTEGVKFARHFYTEGVGTVVDAGQGCFSSCAIIFMMGTARGPEVNFANRRLSIRGRLGFHRPSIRAATDAADSPESIAASYDKALQSALDLVEIGNSQAPLDASPMIKTDLLREMLAHVGNDMFMVETVDHAGRWQIEILEEILVPGFGEEQAFHACENSLQWSVGTLEPGTVDYAEASAGAGNMGPLVKRLETQRPAMYDVTGQKTGYAYAGCLISYDGGAIEGCGVDEYTNVVLGRGSCTMADFSEKSFHLNLLSAFDPRTRLADLPH